MKHSHKVDKLHNNTDYKEFDVEAEVADAIALSEIELLQLHRLVIDEDAVKRISNDMRLNNVRARVQFCWIRRVKNF